jgi:hypothetical protein
VITKKRGGKTLKVAEQGKLKDLRAQWDKVVRQTAVPQLGFIDEDEEEKEPAP